MTKKLILSVSTLAILAFTGVSPVFANQAEQSQKLDQEFEVECKSSGTYGQDTNCKVTGKQSGEQKQRIQILGVTHDASKIGAGLDTQMAAIFGLFMIAGLTSGVLLVKNKI